MFSLQGNVMDLVDLLALLHAPATSAICGHLGRSDAVMVSHTLVSDQGSQFRCCLNLLSIALVNLYYRKQLGEGLFGLQVQSIFRGNQGRNCSRGCGGGLTTGLLSVLSYATQDYLLGGGGGW